MSDEALARKIAQVAGELLLELLQLRSLGLGQVLAVLLLLQAR